VKKPRLLPPPYCTLQPLCCFLSGLHSVNSLFEPPIAAAPVQCVGSDSYTDRYKILTGADFPVGIFLSVSHLSINKTAFALLNSLYYLCNCSGLHQLSTIRLDWFPPWIVAEIISFETPLTYVRILSLWKSVCIVRTKKTSIMKKLNHFHVGEKGKIALLAIGFLTFIMALSYLYWFA